MSPIYSVRHVCVLCTAIALIAKLSSTTTAANARTQLRKKSIQPSAVATQWWKKYTRSRWKCEICTWKTSETVKWKPLRHFPHFQTHHTNTKLINGMIHNANSFHILNNFQFEFIFFGQFTSDRRKKGTNRQRMKIRQLPYLNQGTKCTLREPNLQINVIFWLLVWLTILHWGIFFYTIRIYHSKNHIKWFNIQHSE